MPPVRGRLCILPVLKLIASQVKRFVVPSVTQVSRKRSPYRILISCLLSLRTKDKTTLEASRRLFKIADNPYAMARLTPRRVRGLIYPVGFYRNKAKTIIVISKKIIAQYAGKVPAHLEGLLQFKGVGRKTANLVLGLGFHIPAICVDTHVHRISNRLGWVRTKSPEETESALQKIIPKRYWIDLNTWLVTFGQNICLPVSPFCGKCRVYPFCKRVGVKKFR